MRGMRIELKTCKEKIKENQEKIKLKRQLPYLVGYIVEVGFFSCISLSLVNLSTCVLLGEKFLVLNQNILVELREVFIVFFFHFYLTSFCSFCSGGNSIKKVTLHLFFLLFHCFPLVERKYTVG